MAKKAGRAASEPTAATPVPQRDALQRLSYLYQASILLNNVSLDSSARLNKRRKVDRYIQKEHAGESVPAANGEQRKKEGRDQDQLDGKQAEESAEEGVITSRGTKKNRQSSRVQSGRGEDGVFRPTSWHLIRTMQDVAKKATVRMDPAVKRSVCKNCDVVLIPGITSSPPDLTHTSSFTPARTVSPKDGFLLLHT
ncbi:hypothetical protein JCM5350_003244 [Sporobolomyces pararoseus]